MFNIRDLIRVYMNEAGEGDQSGGSEGQAAGSEGQQQNTSTSLLGGGDDQPQQAAEPFLAALPEEGDAEGWGGVWSKLGKPESAEGYELPLPEGDSGEFMKTSAEWMHKANLTKSQAQALAGEWNAYQAQQAEQQSQAIEKQQTEHVAAVRKEWGQNFDANLAIANKALSTFASPEVIKMLQDSGQSSNPLFVNMFYKIGQSLSEAKAINGEPASSGPKSTADIFYGSN
ncbi:hypothetical protein [Pantoea sp.]|uniref:hypothetical protein n=1 Tax=Pantoea sp. TaxID=69393 RepID=UPI00289E97B0|nr:hypothetical protein [Pantoea sp.]